MKKFFITLIALMMVVTITITATAANYSNWFKYGENVSSTILSDFLGEIKDNQQKIINLIDKKSTEIGYEFYIKRAQS